jgi:hypothetical protein
MIRSQRLTALATAATLGVASMGAVAQASSTSHWSATQCKNYKKNYLKLIKHPTKSQKTKTNKLLKAHGCSVKI